MNVEFALALLIFAFAVFAMTTASVTAVTLTAIVYGQNKLADKGIGALKELGRDLVLILRGRAEHDESRGDAV